MSESSRKTWVICKAVVTNSDSKFLALRRSKTAPANALTWDLPGGVVEYGEDPTEATIREALEEAGQVITDLKPIFISSASSERGYAIVLFFLAKAQSAKVKLSYEHDEYQWMTPEQFLSLESTHHLRAAVSSLMLD